MEVYVVITTDCGWDNIIGIFDKAFVKEEDLKQLFPESDGNIVMDWHNVRTSLDEYKQ